MLKFFIDDKLQMSSVTFKQYLNNVKQKKKLELYNLNKQSILAQFSIVLNFYLSMNLGLFLILLQKYKKSNKKSNKI